MAATRVGSAAFTEATSGSSITAALPQTPTTGNYLLMGVVAFVSSTTTSSVSAPPGWSSGPSGVSTSGTYNVTLALFYKPASSSDTAPVVPVSNFTDAIVGIEEWSGITAFDAAGTLTTGSGSTAVTTVVSPTQANDFVWSVFGQNYNVGGTQPVTWSGGSSADAVFYASTSIAIAFGTQSPSTSASVSPTAVISSASAASSPSAIGGLAFKTVTVSGSTGGHTIATLYPTPTLVSGTKDLFSSTASTATSKSLVSVPALTLTTVNYEYIPEITNSTSGSIPAANTAWNNTGWESQALIPLNDSGVLQANSQPFTVSLTASATGTTAGFTAILYVGGVEIARGTSTPAALPASSVTQTVTLSWAQTVIPPGGKYGVDVWLTATQNTAALNPTTVSLNYGTGGTKLAAGGTYYITASRSSADSTATLDSPARKTNAVRNATEPANASDADTRVYGAFRASADTTKTVDVITRTYMPFRPVADMTTTFDAITRSTRAARAATEPIAATDSMVRLINYGRFTTDGPGDAPVQFPTKSISGVTRDRNGAILGGCIVDLVRQSDSQHVQRVTSDANTGAYSFTRDLFDTNAYYVVSYKPGAMPQVHGVSDRDVVPS